MKYGAYDYEQEFIFMDNRSEVLESVDDNLDQKQFK